MMRCYEKRDELLTQLGYQSYKDYLNSRMWKYVRARVLKRDRSKCLACNEPAQVVHHRSYCKASLRGMRIDYLVSLCHKCHGEAEFSESRKTTVSQDNSYLNKRIWAAGSVVPGMCPNCKKNTSGQKRELCGPCSKLDRIGY